MVSKAVVVKMLREISRTAEPYFADETVAFEEKSNEAELEEESAEALSEYIVDSMDLNAPMILETKGIMTEEGDNVSITYQTHLNDMLPYCITYSFRKNNLDALTVRTFQIAESIDFFTKGRLQLFAEDERTSRGIVSRFTSNLKNRITYENGGYIELEYFDEVDGELASHCKELIVVEPSAAKK